LNILRKNGLNIRGEKIMATKQLFHKVSDIKFVNKTLWLVIDGKEYSFELKYISKVLYRATPHERECYKIDKYGYGIHWPLIDEDLSIDGLLTHCKVGPAGKHVHLL
jgi:hypothetical protein